MSLASVAKAIGATAATIAATGTTVFATVPEGVDMPWYAWLTATPERRANRESCWSPPGPAPPTPLPAC